MVVTDAELTVDAGVNVGEDPGEAPTIPVDAMTATVYDQSGDGSSDRGS